MELGRFTMAPKHERGVPHAVERIHLPRAIANGSSAGQRLGVDLHREVVLVLHVADLSEIVAGPGQRRRVIGRSGGGDRSLVQFRRGGVEPLDAQVVVSTLAARRPASPERRPHPVAAGSRGCAEAGRTGARPRADEPVPRPCRWCARTCRTAGPGPVAGRCAEMLQPRCARIRAPGRGSGTGRRSAPRGGSPGPGRPAAGWRPPASCRAVRRW
jgi:hypothetical protein